MPEFRLCFDLLNVYRELLFAIHKESQLCAYTEVWYCEKWNLFKHWVSAELYIDLLLLIEIMNSQRRYLHNVTYVEQMQPFRLIQVS